MLGKIEDLSDWTRKGLKLEKEDKFEEAIACYTLAIQLNPKDYDAWHGKGKSLSLLMKNKEAIACFDKLIQLKPEKGIGWMHKAFALSTSNKFEEAIACYNVVIQLCDGDPLEIVRPWLYGAWSEKGNALKNLGRVDDAEQCFLNAKKYQND